MARVSGAQRRELLTGGGVVVLTPGKLFKIRGKFWWVNCAHYL